MTNEKNVPVDYCVVDTVALAQQLERRGYKVFAVQIWNGGVVLVCFERYGIRYAAEFGRFGVVYTRLHSDQPVTLAAESGLHWASITIEKITGGAK